MEHQDGYVSTRSEHSEHKWVTSQWRKGDEHNALARDGLIQYAFRASIASWSPAKCSPENPLFSCSLREAALPEEQGGEEEEKKKEEENGKTREKREEVRSLRERRIHRKPVSRERQEEQAARPVVYVGSKGG